MRDNWYRRLQQGVPTRAPNGTMLVDSIKTPRRELDVPNNLVRRVAALGNQTVERVPMSQLPRFTKTWCECLEGMAKGNPQWCTMGRVRARLLLTNIPPHESKFKELEARIKLWEDGRIRTLLERVEAEEKLEAVRADKQWVVDG